jgi:hypothetical protein
MTDCEETNDIFHQPPQFLNIPSTVSPTFQPHGSTGVVSEFSTTLRRKAESLHWCCPHLIRTPSLLRIVPSSLVVNAGGSILSSAVHNIYYKAMVSSCLELNVRRDLLPAQYSQGNEVNDAHAGIVMCCDPWGDANDVSVS